MEIKKDQEQVTSLEALKAELVEQTIRLGKAGEQLRREHPRYEKTGGEMVETSERLTRCCNEALYSMSLGAPFQTGKSTTCNTFADGREICPCGNGGGGIRTSSCAVRINNTDEQHAGATITWADENQLDAAMLDALGLSQEPELLSLREPKDREAAWKQVKDLVDDYVADPKCLDERQADGMKQALLILSYYDDPQMEDLRKQTEFSLDRAQRFLAFPSDNIQRWGKMFQEYAQMRWPKESALRELVRKFWSVEMAAYPFINVADFYTPSEYLRSLGVVVIDTPGLNMSANDTRTALLAMQSSSAIFYFFSGEKQLSQEERASLRKLQECGLSSKVFFGLNFRTSARKRAAVEESILSDLEQMGFVLPHQRSLLHFNAFLAQRAKQGMLLLAGKLDENTRRSILACAEDWEIPCETVEQAWVATTAEVMSEVKAPGYRDLEDLGLCQESVDMVFQASNWQETMDRINDFVLHNRGRVLLIDQVADPITRQLSAIERELLTKEADAMKEYDSLKDMYEKAEKQYQEFEKKTGGILERFITEEWEKNLAVDYYQKVIQASAGPAAEKSAKDVLTLSASVGKNFGHLFTRFTNHFRQKENQKKSKLEAQIEKVITDALGASIEENSIAWTEQLEESSVYKSNIQSNVENVQLRIKDIWTELKMDENEALQQLGVQLQDRFPKGVFSTDTRNIQLSSSALSAILGRNNIDFLGSLWDILCGFGTGGAAAVGLAYLYVYILPLDFVIPGAAEIIVAMSVIIGALVSWLSSESRKAKKLREKQESLRLNLVDKFSDPEFQKEQIARLQNGDPEKPGSGLKIYRLFYQNVFKDTLDQARKDLSRRKEDALKAASLGDQTRQEIAEEARGIREEIVLPLKEAVQTLKERIDEACLKG